jgi:uncharacterized membrane protein
MAALLHRKSSRRFVVPQLFLLESFLAQSVAYHDLRRDLGKAILVGLELLVAADIIRSVALDPTFATICVLGLIVVVRTFLSWSLELEVNGRWPWQSSRSPNDAIDG